MLPQKSLFASTIRNMLKTTTRNWVIHKTAIVVCPGEGLRILLINLIKTRWIVSCREPRRILVLLEHVNLIKFSGSFIINKCTLESFNVSFVSVCSFSYVEVNLSTPLCLKLMKSRGSIILWWSGGLSHF